MNTNPSETLSESSPPSYLPSGLPAPTPSPDGLDEPFWSGLARNELLLQSCENCGRFQWGPEWICHRCHSFHLTYKAVEPTGLLYSHQRVWHPVHPALNDHGPYIIALVELPHADNVRIIGNLVGDPQQPLVIGSPVAGVFEHHPAADEQGRPPFTLLHWQTA